MEGEERVGNNRGGKGSKERERARTDVKGREGKGEWERR